MVKDCELQITCNCAENATVIHGPDDETKYVTLPINEFVGLSNVTNEEYYVEVMLNCSYNDCNCTNTSNLSYTLGKD